MAFDLMRDVLLTRGAKRRQVQIYLLDCLFIFGSPTHAFVREAGKCFSLVPRRVASRLLQAVEIIPARVLALGCSWL